MYILNCLVGLLSERRPGCFETSEKLLSYWNVDELSFLGDLGWYIWLNVFVHSLEKPDF